MEWKHLVFTARCFCSFAVHPLGLSQSNSGGIHEETHAKRGLELYLV